MQSLSHNCRNPLTDTLTLLVHLSQCLSNSWEGKSFFPNGHVVIGRLCIEKMSVLWGKYNGRKSSKFISEG